MRLQTSYIKLLRYVSRVVIILLPILSLLTIPVDARRNKLTIKATKSAAVIERPWEIRLSPESDSVEFAEVSSRIVLSGYDKNTSSSTERWFVQNGSERHLRSITVEISYQTLQGRQLHQREVTVNVNIPAGETRMVEVKSFDKQMTFYYHKSQSGRRAATPYDIRIRILSLTCDR